MTMMSKNWRTMLVAAPLLVLASAAAGQQTNPPKERSGIDKVGDTVENIGAKPLKDMNIIKDKVDPRIEAAMEEPYSLKGIKTCAQFKTAITTLTGVLGPDVDSPQAQRKDQTPAEFALSLGESAAGSIIPFMGVVRKISGADARQKYAQAAIYAGSVRRAYLKGTARQKGCKI
ncbi:hypothetical protein GCM10011529_25720 [Polymorphobacter glacialis]|uniref:Uncharacterized protein n=1 Tax=Sandarakinorhabdus glacialis TaxID=1614636 RepID=A0A917EAC1_9SPHN|nr:hypothetical protein [Polymorphobacter glacialis]GGE18062.1 hypothetical protein GCM10011529_25720 [Polymorphobacter glacialis]